MPTALTEYKLLPHIPCITLNFILTQTWVLSRGMKNTRIKPFIATKAWCILTQYNPAVEPKLWKIGSAGSLPVYPCATWSNGALTCWRSWVFTDSCTTMDWHEFGGCPLCERERRGGGRRGRLLESGGQVFKMYWECFHTISHGISAKNNPWSRPQRRCQIVGGDATAGLICQEGGGRFFLGFGGKSIFSGL